MLVISDADFLFPFDRKDAFIFHLFQFPVHRLLRQKERLPDRFLRLFNQLSFTDPRFTGEIVSDSLHRILDTGRICLLYTSEIVIDELM